MPRSTQPLKLTESVISRQHRVWIVSFNAHLASRDFDQSHIDQIRQLPITGLALPKGLARAYYQTQQTVPLIIQLNSKGQSPLSDQALAPLTCTVAEAVDLQAKAVVYTIYLGSIHLPTAVQELRQIKKQAARHRLLCIADVRMAGIKLDHYRQTNMLAYAATISKSWSVDYVWLPSSNDHHQAKVADLLDRTHLLADISTANNPDDLLLQTKQVMASGAAGIVTDHSVLDQLNTATVQKMSRAVFGLT